MLLGDIVNALPGLQVEAESLMVTPCKVIRPTGVTVDPETGVDAPVYADVPVYESDAVGKPGCKIQERDLEVNPAEIPGGTMPISRWEIQVPVSTGPFAIGDVVQILDDGQQVVREFRVTGLHRKTWQTEQRLPAEEL